MRIISGTHKGRGFHPPKNLPVRPTTDFGKEALFNILNNRVDFEVVRALDLFSGTGSISYELASRGCKDITSVEADAGCCFFIKKTSSEFGFLGISVVKSDVFRYLKGMSDPFDLVFADPPYELKRISEIPGIIMDSEILKNGGMLILEHPGELGFQNTPGYLETRKYSKVNFSIFSK